MSGPRNSDSEFPSIDYIDRQFERDIADNQRMFDDQMSEDDAPVHPGHRSRNGDNYDAFDE